MDFNSTGIKATHNIHTVAELEEITTILLGFPVSMVYANALVAHLIY